MFYKLLGFVVWQVARWYLRRKLSSAAVPALVATGVVGAGIVAAAVAHARRGDDGSAA